MEKLIVDDVTFKVPVEEEKEFLEFMKSFKNKLESNDLLPFKWGLFHDIDKEKDVWKLFMVFESDAKFDVWESKAMEYMKEFRPNFDKYFKSYNYSEEVLLARK